MLLRTLDYAGRGRCGFKWPTIGRVEMREGQRFGGLVWGQGDMGRLDELLHHDPTMLWQVVAVEHADLFGHAASAGEVIYVGDREAAIELLSACAPPGVPLPWATVRVGDHGTAVTGHYGNSIAGDYGTAVAGERGNAVAGRGGIAAVGRGGTLTLTSDDGRTTRTLGTESGIEPGRLYALQSDGSPSGGARLLLDDAGWYYVDAEQVVRLVTTGQL